MEALTTVIKTKKKLTSLFNKKIKLVEKCWADYFKLVKNIRMELLKKDNINRDFFEKGMCFPFFWQYCREHNAFRYAILQSYMLCMILTQQNFNVALENNATTIMLWVTLRLEYLQKIKFFHHTLSEKFIKKISLVPTEWKRRLPQENIDKNRLVKSNFLETIKLRI